MSLIDAARPTRVHAPERRRIRAVVQSRISAAFVERRRYVISALRACWCVRAVRPVGCRHAYTTVAANLTRIKRTRLRNHA